MFRQRAWDWYTARHFVLQASLVTTIATAFNTLPLSAAMLAAAIFLQLSPQDGRKPKANSEHELEH